MKFSLYILYTLYGLLSLCQGSDKRILLNDNDVYQQLQDLQQLKTEFASFQSKFSAQEMEINTLRNTVAVQNKTISFLEHRFLLQNQTVAQQVQKITALQLTVQTQDQTIKQISKGFAAGGMHNEIGSAAEYVCLPHDPYILSNVKSEANYAHIYGVEYEDNFYGGFHNKDVPCAVCLANSATSVLMIPGKITCNTGWKLEYSGTLSSGSYGAPAASQYVCVDSHPDVLEAGYEDKNGKRFFPVYGKCRSLRCPPYEDNKILSCVVCSK